jgi:small subunit ribosomal protein S2
MQKLNDDMEKDKVKKTEKVDKAEKTEKVDKVEKVEKKTVSKKTTKELEEMFKIGVHFGHYHSRKHPAMDKFVYCVRNNVDIIDIEETQENLEKAIKYLLQKKKEESLMLFVGTKVAARDLVRNLAEKLNSPFVTERWLGGTLTNFEVIKKRIEEFKEMEIKKEKGELEKYTKKERLRFNQEIERTEKKIGGLRKLNRLPDILFVVDVHNEKHAIEEAKKKNIPVVAICDTDGNPNQVDYAIPANDDNISSLTFIINKIEKALV